MCVEFIVPHLLFGISYGNLDSVDYHWNKILEHEYCFTNSFFFLWKGRWQLVSLFISSLLIKTFECISGSLEPTFLKITCFSKLCMWNTWNIVTSLTFHLAFYLNMMMMFVQTCTHAVSAPSSKNNLQSWGGWYEMFTISQISYLSDESLDAHCPHHIC